MARLFLLLVLTAVACRNKAPETFEPAESMAMGDGRARVTQLTLPMALTGISGLCGAGDGTFWAVPERDRRLFRIEVRKDRAFIRSTLPIRGAPENQDLESIAMLAPGRLAFGTETTESRTSDTVIFGRLAGGGIQIDDDAGPAWTLEYGPWQTRPGRNRGLEALCYADGQLLAVSETVVMQEPDRLAPLAVRAVGKDGTWARASLRLTSQEGKISAVACRSGASGRIDAVAIERHFGTMRIVRFSVDPKSMTQNPLDKPIPAEVIADLKEPYRGSAPPNFEGLAWADDETLLIISDNDYRGVSGPTTVLRLDAAPASNR